MEAFNRRRTGLTKMVDRRPRKQASFLRHVQAILGKDSPAAAVEAAVRELERANVVQIAGDLVFVQLGRRCGCSTRCWRHNPRKRRP